MYSQLFKTVLQKFCAKYRIKSIPEFENKIKNHETQTIYRSITEKKKLTNVKSTNKQNGNQQNETTVTDLESNDEEKNP